MTLNLGVVEFISGDEYHRASLWLWLPRSLTVVFAGWPPRVLRYRR